MDYKAIYWSFIADRAQRAASGYVEVHHIVPKSMGGSDDVANLIALTPEDHFFAHLLLAKGWGGGQWYAVVRMGAGRRDGKRGWARARFMYGVAKRKVAEATSARCKGQPGNRGAANGMHDPAVLRWVNMDTQEVVCASKWDMWSRFGGCRAHWTSAANGARKTMRGWTPHPDRVAVRSKKGKEIRFVCSDGRTFLGTQKAFAEMARLSAASASRVAAGVVVTSDGWRVAP